MRVSVGPERLVGACLIAKPRRGAWAGVPLIALPPSPPSSGGSAIDEQIVSLSQLALHAQGSPLVLAPRAARKAAGAGACGAEEFSSQPTPPSTPDSGGSLASDDPAPPLPRVLKPRKRRKRERAASAPGPGPPNTPSALCACAVCRATLLRAPPPSHQQPPTPPVSPLQAKIGYSWDDIVPQKCECCAGSQDVLRVLVRAFLGCRQPRTNLVEFCFPVSSRRLVTDALVPAPLYLTQLLPAGKGGQGGSRSSAYFEVPMYKPNVDSFVWEDCDCRLRPFPLCLLRFSSTSVGQLG